MMLLRAGACRVFLAAIAGMCEGALSGQHAAQYGHQDHSLEPSGTAAPSIAVHFAKEALHALLHWNYVSHVVIGQ